MPKKLRMLRNACGYSQKELAEKSGVNLRTFQEYVKKIKSGFGVIVAVDFVKLSEI